MQARTNLARPLELEYITPSRMITVVLDRHVRAEGLLDEGAEASLMSEELWFRLDVPMDITKTPGARGLQGERVETVGCVEYLEITVDGFKTWGHVFVVKGAPFQLILGCPWQRGVQLGKVEGEHGVAIVIHDQLHESPPKMVGTYPALDNCDPHELGRRYLEMWKTIGPMVKRDMDALLREGRDGTMLHLFRDMMEHFADRLAPAYDNLAPFGNVLLASFHRLDPVNHTIAHKHAARKVHPFPTVMHECAKEIRLSFKDTFASPPLSPPRLTGKQLDVLGALKHEFFWPYREIEIVHKPWTEKTLSILRGIRDEIIASITKNISLWLHEASNTSNLSQRFVVAKSSGDLTTFDTPIGTPRSSRTPQGWTRSIPVFKAIASSLQGEKESSPNPVEDPLVFGAETRYESEGEGYKMLEKKSDIRPFVWERAKYRHHVFHRPKHGGVTIS